MCQCVYNPKVPVYGQKEIQAGPLNVWIGMMGGNNVMIDMTTG